MCSAWGRLGGMPLIGRPALAKFAIFSTACLVAWIAPGPVIGIANGFLGGSLSGPAGRWAYVVTGLVLLLGITRLALWRLGGPTEGPPSTLFTAPLTTAQAQALWSPDVLPHVPYLVVMVLSAIVVALWNSPTKAGPIGARASA